MGGGSAFFIDSPAAEVYHMPPMRIPLTKYGWPQVVVYPAAVVLVMIAIALAGLSKQPAWPAALIEVVFAAVLVWILLFFRDPHRETPRDGVLLLAPADGRITDIAMVDETDFMEKPAVRIGIFLSIFDTHINRAPCNATVQKVTYRKGKYTNAMNPLSGKVNESNAVALLRAEDPRDRLVVRQISGAIARRIVCAVRPGQQLTGGERFGMIKFGSRTELYVPAGENIECIVQIGDKVRAGITPLARYKICHD